MTPHISGLRSEPSAERVCGIPDGSDRIEFANRRAYDFSIATLTAALRSDRVVLVRNALEGEADQIMADVAADLGLITGLEGQAAFAAIQGHRKNVSKYFMTVNRRKQFAIVLPHSEGTRFQGIQLASLYCYENTTDGGVTMLVNYDQTSAAWRSMRELITRIDPSGGPLTATGRAIARAKFMAEELPGADDLLLEHRQSDMPDVKLLWALTPLGKSFSKVLQREVYTYWDSVASVDVDSVKECVRLLEGYDLLRQPVNGARIDHLDPAYGHRLWSSGVAYADLFQSVIVHKLRPGDLIIQNNLTWAHAASNWTPGSGIRKIIAAFA